MSPQAFVNQLNQQAMPSMGYVQHGGQWLLPAHPYMHRFGVHFYHPDGRVYQ